METDFDVHAKNYNEKFTFSLIGKAQRERIYFFLNQHKLLNENLSILELNCGTGFDANYFYKKGNTVLATDISSKMIQIAKENYKESTIKFKQLDINSITSESFTEKFDFIFSNFGGLNCLSPAELTSFLSTSTSLLKPNGKMALVLMPKNCLWEQFYFVLKGEFKKVKRRNTNNTLLVNVENQKVKTWYYNPKDVISIISKKYNIVSLNPIGIALPPSYLNPFFKKKKVLFKLLVWKEKLLSQRFWAQYSDHYLLILQKK